MLGDPGRLLYAIFGLGLRRNFGANKQKISSIEMTRSIICLPVHLLFFHLGLIQTFLCNTSSSLKDSVAANKGVITKLIYLNNQPSLVSAYDGKENFFMSSDNIAKG